MPRIRSHGNGPGPGRRRRLNGYRTYDDMPVGAVYRLRPLKVTSLLASRPGGGGEGRDSWAVANGRGGAARCGDTLGAVAARRGVTLDRAGGERGGGGQGWAVTLGSVADTDDEMEVLARSWLSICDRLGAAVTRGEDRHRHRLPPRWRSAPSAIARRTGTPAARISVGQTGLIQGSSVGRIDHGGSGGLVGLVDQLVIVEEPGPPGDGHDVASPRLPRRLRLRRRTDGGGGLDRCGSSRRTGPADPSPQSQRPPDLHRRLASGLEPS